MNADKRRFYKNNREIKTQLLKHYFLIFSALRLGYENFICVHLRKSASN